MRFLAKTASVATLSFFLFTSAAHARPDDATPPATASSPASFDRVSLSIQSMVPMGGADMTFNIKSDGSYTVETGSKAPEVVARGTLTSAQLQSLGTALDATVAARPPRTLAGSAFGSPDFIVSWSKNGTSGSTRGSTDTQGAIQDTQDKGLDTSVWKVVASLERTLADLAKKVQTRPAFDEISLEESGPNGKSKLTIEGDGSYALTREEQSPRTGTLTSDQLAAISAAYDPDAVQRNDGRLLGTPVLDGTDLKLTATSHGKTSTVVSFVGSDGLGSLAKLVSTLDAMTHAVSQPVADTAASKDHSADPAGLDAIRGRGQSSQGPRTGMSALIEERSQAGSPAESVEK